MGLGNSTGCFGSFLTKLCTDQERHLPCRFSLLPFTLCSHILPITGQVDWTYQEALPEDMGTVEFQGHTHTPAQQEAVVM